MRFSQPSLTFTLCSGTPDFVRLTSTIISISLTGGETGVANANIRKSLIGVDAGKIKKLQEKEKMKGGALED